MTRTSLSQRVLLRARRLGSRTNRMVLLELVRSNLRSSDCHSLLGGMWSILSTGAMLALLYLVFSRSFGTAVPGYPLYLLAGIVPVNFFITATGHLLKVFIYNRDIALNSTIPRESLVLATVSLHGWKLGIEMLLCALVSLACGSFSVSAALILLPVVVAFLALVVGVGLVLALSFCFARDVEHVWTIVSRLFFFASPVFYTLESLPPNVRLLVEYGNPLMPFLTAFRGVFLHRGVIEAGTLAQCAMLGATALVLGYLAFIRLEGAAMDRA
jgi:ABC-2 type transport system permease protein